MADPKSFFIRALEYVLGKEGGFVDNPNDSGGATKFGVTLKVLQLWRGKSVTVDDVRSLEKAEVFEIYYDRYWLPVGCQEMTQYPVALAVFDATVLFGIGITMLYTQKALSDCGYSGVTIDGHIGPKSIAALNQVDPARFLRVFHTLFTLRISKVVQDNPKNQVFKAGWLNRINAYLGFADPSIV